MNSASSAFAIQRSMVEAEQEFDLIIIGGGITGISVAREAASRGLKTILLERGDFGSGTSAATTKYIHGGIRYLEQYDVAVVRESLRERRILALGAPHLVEQTRFIMPACTISLHRRSYSSCEPSTQWIASGLHSSAIFSTQRSKCLFVLRGVAEFFLGIVRSTLACRDSE